MASVAARFVLVLALLLHACNRARGGSIPEQEASRSDEGRHIVPLHKQRIPVRSEEGVLSFKSVYFGTVFVGAPTQQRFSMIFDTGSGHVIVPSRMCRSEACSVHNRYDVSLSELGTDIDADGSRVLPGASRDQMTIAFGTGEVTGQFVTDRFCLGSHLPELYDQSEANPNASEVMKPGVQNAERSPGCTDMRIVAATEMSFDPFASFSFDGVVGLGLDALALSPEFSFFSTLVAAGNIAEPSFGVFLADSDDDFSEISFGGVNPSRLKSELSWAPVELPELGHWQVKILEVRVGNVTLDFCQDGQCRGVVDTGTSLLVVPSSFIDPLYNMLEGPLQDPLPDADGRIDCREASGDQLEFVIDGSTLELGPGDYARPSITLDANADVDTEVAAAAALAGDTVLATTDVASGGGSNGGGAASCHPTLMPIDLPEPLGPKLFILGEPVLRKYYTAYDWQRKQIGFALAAHGNQDEKQETPSDSNKKKAFARPLLLLQVKLSCNFAIKQRPRAALPA